MRYSPLSSAVRFHKALAHPARLRILAMLAERELCVCEITELLQLAPSTVSAHLKELKRAELTIERRDGKWIYLSLRKADGSLLGEVLKSLEEDPQILSDRSKIREILTAASCEMKER